MSNLKNYLFTSESVSEGHPDKVSIEFQIWLLIAIFQEIPFQELHVKL